MKSTFGANPNLQTIWASNNFVVDKVSSEDNLFYEDFVLRGSKGTRFESSKYNKVYAHIDGGESNPGYFSDKTIIQPYAIQDTSGNLTLYYDYLPTDIGDNKLFINFPRKATSMKQWPWYETSKEITGIISFDESFRNCHEFTEVRGMLRNTLATKIDCTNFDVSGIAKLDYIFEYNEQCTEIILGDFNMLSTISAEGMFQACYKLESLDSASMHGGCHRVNIWQISSLDAKI